VKALDAGVSEERKASVVGGLSRLARPASVCDAACSPCTHARNGTT
jgi:hypothetical protein